MSKLKTEDGKGNEASAQGKGLKIGFFADSYFPRKDGQVYTVKTWKQKLEARGHEVYVIYPGSDHEPGEYEIALRSVKNPWYKHYIGLPLGTGSLPDLDVVHCHSPGPIGLLGRYYARKKDIASVYTFHTPLEEYIPQVVRPDFISTAVNRAYRWIDNKFLNSFDAVTSNTAEIPRDIEFTELPVGIDMDYFHETGESFVDEMDVERPVLGYSGRLSEEKKIDQLIEFFEGLEGTLIIVGEGRDEERLKQKASENVVFRDFLPREKLPEFYSGIDVFATCSESDTLSLTTLEASACGTPVLAPDVHPFDGTINGNGECFRPGDREDFEAKLEKVLEKDYSTRKEVERFSMEKSIDKLIELYREVM
ncbi:MAG: glycosyltransferase [Candidatus Nanohalobium sp.]